MSSSIPRVALVTGAAKRIGRAIALALARDGWDIAVHYSNSRAEAEQTANDIAALGRRVVTVACDLGDEHATAALIEGCEQQLGGVSCVVNNASIFDYDNVATFSSAQLERHMRINVTAPLLLAQALHARLPNDARGVVINLLDQKLWNPNPDFLSYTLSKAALKESTTLLAQALAPKLRVVGVAPGVTLPSHLQTAESFARTHAMAPLGKAGNASDIANAVVYLAGATAVTGAVLLVDGGQHLEAQKRDYSFL